jgi:DNA-binding response OmpR family regulator
MIKKREQLTPFNYWNEAMATIYKFDHKEKTNLPIFRTRKQGRILLVESDSNTRQALELLLVSQGYQVIVAADIDKAYRLNRFKGFTFILFNWFMEGEAGLDLCKQIRIVNKATPLFFYTKQDHEDGSNSINVNVQGCDAQSITTHAMLNAIFTSHRNRQPENNRDIKDESQLSNQNHYGTLTS